ncbi:MAG: PD-(D/E)XK nuclease family protein [Synergistaceae bacterium]|jgi:hypothetical protein|nr:PD-(D/E)XK nuclease family protein [Synergistaceae bacterium]
MITVSSYAKLSSLKVALAAYASPDRAAKLVYILPSKSNEGPLLDMLRGDGDYFARKPEVWSWQDLYGAIVPKDARRRCVDPPDHNLALRHVIEKTVSDYDARGISLPPGVREKNFALPLGEAINELMLEDVGPESLCGPDDEGVSRPALLRNFYAAYKIYLEENKLADNSDIPSLASAALDASHATLPATIAGRILCFVGFMSFTGAQLKLLKKLDALGLETAFFAPDPDTRGFRDAAAQLGAYPKDIGTDRICVVKTVAPDTYSEYEWVALTIAASDENEDIGVMTPAGRLARLTRALKRHGIPWQLRSEVTVLETAAAEFAARAWEVHKSGWPPLGASHLLRSAAAGVEIDPARMAAVMPEGLEAWKKFLTGPDTAGLRPAPRKGTDPLDPMKGSGEPAPRRVRAEPAIRAADVLSRVEAFCGMLSDETGHTPRELLLGFAALCGDGEWENRVAGEIGDDAELDAAIREIASSRREINLKIDMLEDVSPALGEASSLRFSGDDALGFLLFWAGEAALALPPKMTGVVSVYVSPPPVLAGHDLWIMTDADASRYPGQESGQPMLDDSLRERVNGECGEYSHLPTLREKRRQKEALFRRMLAVGERRAVVFRSALNDSGEPVEESAFMKPEFFSDSSRWSLTENMPCGNTREIENIDRDARPRAVRETEREAKLRIAMSGMDTLLDCPFAWWCRAARFETVDEPRDIIDRMSLGGLTHQIWKRISGALPLDGAATHRSAILSEWDDIISSLRGEFPVLSDARPAAALGVMKKNMLGVADYLDRAAAKADAAGMKRLWTKTEMTLPELEFEHAVFTGRADRVDFWAWPGGEGAVIYDYKIGSGAGYAKRLQLSAYAAALEASGVPVAGFCYLCHGDGKTPGAWRPEIGPVFAASSKITPCEDRITFALEQMRGIDMMLPEGNFDARYDSDSCPKCDYSVLCRRGETRDELDDD